MHNVSRRTAFFVPPLITSPRRAVHTLSPIFLSLVHWLKRDFFPLRAKLAGRCSFLADTLSRIFIPPLQKLFHPPSFSLAQLVRIYMYIYGEMARLLRVYMRVQAWRDERRRRRSDGGGTALIKQRIRVSSRSAVSAFDEPFIFQ